MNRVAKFEKVSFKQFKHDWLDKNPTSKTEWTDEELMDIYNNIRLPKRGTVGSAGYDFFAPMDINLKFGEAVVIPTGLRCKIDNSWLLDINPRSGHGFKFGVRIANTRGIIDSDYYGADNEGHIMVKLVNDCEAINKEHKVFEVERSKGFCQGIFTLYGLVEDDECEEKRTNGFGHTDKVKENERK